MITANFNYVAPGAAGSWASVLGAQPPLSLGPCWPLLPGPLTQKWGAWGDVLSAPFPAPGPRSWFGVSRVNPSPADPRFASQPARGWRNSAAALQEGDSSLLWLRPAQEICT